LASLVAAGGAYVWKGVLNSSQESYKTQLAERERQFNIDLIEELKRANTRIDLASKLLANHLAISQVFDVIARLTISNVRFTSLELARDPAAPGEEIRINMRGYGTSLSAVAFQSDVLGQLEQYGLRKVVKNPMLTDPTIDQGGTVSFGFSATLDPSTMTYAKSVRGEAPSDDTAGGAPSAAPTP
jgi:hypothetical protein